jgi:hypothetical protein
MCIADAIEFDTGFLNSNTHFGINTDKHDSIEYRRVMTCAPIATNGFVSEWVNATELNYVPGLGVQPVESETFLKYGYGQGIPFEDNTTFAYSNLSFVASVGWNYPFEIYKLE